jgi:hypothetical protein
MVVTHTALGNPNGRSGIGIMNRAQKKRDPKRIVFGFQHVASQRLLPVAAKRQLTEEEEGGVQTRCWSFGSISILREGDIVFEDCLNRAGLILVRGLSKNVRLKFELFM